MSLAAATTRITPSPALKHLKLAINHLTPLSLAEAWDNVGTIVEAPFPRQIQGVSKVVCCVDLTENVTDEALDDPDTALILCYHPPIFSGIKQFNLETALQRSLLRSIASGVSVYCIHTAADNALEGVNDFIGKGLLVDGRLRDDRVKPITLASNPPAGQEGSGSGRIVDLSQSDWEEEVTIEGVTIEGVTIEELVRRIKQRLDLPYVQLARSSRGSELIKTVAICAGSGSGVLKNVKADLYLTGEFGHHDILLANAQGTHVITCNHSATERPWLSEFTSQLASRMNETAIQDGTTTKKYDVVMSKVDAEPLVVV